LDLQFVSKQSTQEDRSFQPGSCHYGICPNWTDKTTKIEATNLRFYHFNQRNSLNGRIHELFYSCLSAPLPQHRTKSQRIGARNRTDLGEGFSKFTSFSCQRGRNAARNPRGGGAARLAETEEVCVGEGGEGEEEPALARGRGRRRRPDKVAAHSVRIFFSRAPQSFPPSQSHPQG
jgi:hypothetical protein